ncbi:metallophosphoesterase [Sedimentibacter sp. MB31-C6]|uniref:metallophosphoesterase n=1 Tax=Sedimentibacter sp. MB31-C6 TaxID=3109366 RepID=UPI002DDCDC90|nr:metallophosphoesterase [Sedimentibacter sp. MB36-C1]WSI03003.1 metallophosphoesterase [Sedimentibacter sp. MB36-C1]
MKKTILLILVCIIIFFLVNPDIISQMAFKIKFGDDLILYVVSDLHYLSEKLYDNGEAFNKYVESGDKLLQYTEVFLNVFKEKVLENKPDFVVFAGDLTSNGSKVSHMDLSDKLSEIEDSGTKVYVIPGNHDLNNTRSIYFDKEEVHRSENISNEDFVDIYGQFGYNEAAFRDKESLSYLAKPNDKVWLLMLDSTKPYPYSGGRLEKSTLEWVKECSNLAKEEDVKMIAVMHHSLVDHSKIINFNYTIDNSKEVVELMHKSDIDIVLTGHIHLQDIKSNEYEGRTLYDISTSCISIYPHQFGQLSYSPWEGYEYKTMKLNMEEYAKTNNMKNESLEKFEVYSENFFKVNCCKNQKNCVEDIESLSEDEKAKVVETVSEMNKMYFAGYRNEALNKITETEGFKLLESIEDCPVKRYAMAILNDERADNNILIINFAE